MNYRKPTLIERIIPFIAIGIFLVLFVAGLILFSYILLWGAGVGLVLFGIAYIKEHLFSKKKSSKQPRIIEHDESNDD